MNLPKSLSSVLVPCVLTLLLASCTSEKARLETMLAEAIRPNIQSQLPEGAVIENIDATVTAQAGLEFTGKATARIRLPALFAAVFDDSAFAGEARDALSAEFEKTLEIPAGGHTKSDIEDFQDLVTRSGQSLLPAFVETVPDGQTITATYATIDGRRSGDSVRIQRFDPPDIDWPESAQELPHRITTLPKGAQIFASETAFFAKRQEAFQKLLANDAATLKAVREKEKTRRLGLVTGTWKGTTIQRIVDRSDFEATFRFETDGSCSGILTEDREIHGIGVTQLKIRMEFSGSWSLTGDAVKVTVKQTRWVESLKQVAGPGSNKPGRTEEHPLSDKELTLHLKIDEDRARMTFTPRGVELKSAKDGQMFLMVPMDLEKAPEPPPPTPTPAPTKLKPSGSIDTTVAPSSTPMAAADSGPAQGSSTAILPSSTLDDMAVFQPSPETKTPPVPHTSLPPSDPPARGEIFPLTRQRQLTAEDIVGWDCAKIQNALNEMYARHGLVFKDKNLQRKFSATPWYQPNPAITSEEIDARFTPIETANRLMLVEARANASTTPAKSKSPSKKLSKIYRPKDPLPDNLAGTGVAGEFLLIGTDRSGRPVLIAKDDKFTIAPRRFCLVNDDLRETPRVYLSIKEFVPIRVSEEFPLRFIGRDGVPGSYQVEATKDPRK